MLKFQPPRRGHLPTKDKNFWSQDVLILLQSCIMYLYYNMHAYILTESTNSMTVHREIGKYLKMTTLIDMHITYAPMLLTLYIVSAIIICM